MDSSASLCVYCGEPNETPSEEHVIADALGGTLTTTAVCTSCNSKMGADVDAPFCDSLLLRLLRYNFKDYLPSYAIPKFTIRAALVAPDGSDRILGDLRFSDGGMEFQPAFETRVEGNVTTYIVPDTSRGRAAFQGILNSRTKKITQAEWVDLPPHNDCITLSTDGFLRFQRPLVKMCLGFIAAEVSPDLAGDSRFDVAREFLQGERDDLYGRGFEMRTGVATDAIELRDSAAHELGFVMKNGYPLFSVTLFDSVQFEMKVGNELPILPATKKRVVLRRRRRTLGVPLFRLFPP